MANQTVYVNTKTSDVTPCDMYTHTHGVLRRLFCEHETVNVYVFVVDRIPFRYASSLAAGVCAKHQNANTYLVYITNIPTWRYTLSHELYHVFQYENELPLYEREANQFADMVRNGTSDDDETFAPEMIQAYNLEV